MTEELKQLIDDCMTMWAEYFELLSIKIAMIPSWVLIKYFKVEMMPEEEQKELREKCQKLGGREEVDKKYNSLRKDLNEKFAVLAEILDEEDFEIEHFRTVLNQKQYSWLSSHASEIKKQLKGIDII